jgi:hypothetical protein
MMMKKVLGGLLLLCVTLSTRAQLMIDALDTDYTIDFTGFAGEGFAPDPTDGQLDSDTWKVTGLSDGDLEFGDTGTSGDYAKGTTTGFVTSGGIYAADVFGNQGLMVQPTADDFTPGSFVLRLENNTGSTIGELDVAYTIYALNDQNRANSFNFSYSYDDETWIEIGDLDYTSPEFGVGIPEFEDKATTLIGLIWDDGQFFYLRWTGDDVSGSGSRDEFALDDIVVNASEGEAIVVGGFSSTSATVAEDGTSIDIDVELTSDADCTLEVTVNDGSVAENDVDFSLADPTVLTFFEGSDFIQTITVAITDDADVEGDESFLLDLAVTAGTCLLGAADQVEVTITDNDEPVATVVDIADVTGEDADGIATSDGDFVTMTGVVYGGNLRDGGLDFTIIDNTAGIKVFNFSETLGYTPAEGDEITVTGFITQFNGLTEIIPEELTFNSADNTLKVPVAVSNLDESTESDLVQLSNCTLNDPAQWLGDGSSFNLDVTCDGTPIVMRIDDLVNLSTMEAPEGAFNLTGIGGQFDTDAPYLQGYQILPRYSEDIEAIIIDNIESPDAATIAIFPNPNRGQFALRLSDLESDAAVQVIDMTGKVVNDLMISQSMNGAATMIELPAAGIYQLVISTNNGTTIKEVVVQ